MARLKRLTGQLKQYRPGAPKKYPSLAIVGEVETIPVRGTKSVTYTAIVKSQHPSLRAKQAVDARSNPSFDGKAPPAKQYKVSIRFGGIEFSGDVDKANRKRFSEVTAEKNNLVFFEKPTVSKHNIFMRCSCPDFRHRFEHQLKSANSLIGQPRSYKRITPLPPDGRPFVNPKDLEGYCKHITSFVRALIKSKTIRLRAD